MDQKKNLVTGWAVMIWGHEKGNHLERTDLYGCSEPRIRIPLYIPVLIRKCYSFCSGSSDTTSHTNTFELYGSANKGDPNLYPPPPSDDTRSYGTYDKSMDDFSDDYIRDYDVSG